MKLEQLAVTRIAFFFHRWKSTCFFQWSEVLFWSATSSHRYMWFRQIGGVIMEMWFNAVESWGLSIGKHWYCRTCQQYKRKCVWTLNHTRSFSTSNRVVFFSYEFWKLRTVCVQFQVLVFCVKNGPDQLPVWRSALWFVLEYPVSPKKSRWHVRPTGLTV